MSKKGKREGVQPKSNAMADDPYESKPLLRENSGALETKRRSRLHKNDTGDAGKRKINMDPQTHYAAPLHMTLWVKKEGDPTFVKLRSSVSDISDLLVDIRSFLQTLQHIDPSSLTVYVSDADGMVVGEALNTHTHYLSSMRN